MGREVVDHRITADDQVRILVTDRPGSGGANHRYEISGVDESRNPSLLPGERIGMNLRILFQNGPIPENGANGVTQEVLLAIVADRLRSFQNGPFACRENQRALDHVEEALHWLQQRTISRIRRGVEGSERL